MTYEEFKKQLYVNVSEQVQLKRCRIRVKLYEKQVWYTQKEDLHRITVFSLGGCGRTDATVREDMLCVFWQWGENAQMIKWQVRVLYERWKQEGWGGILPEIVTKIVLLHTSLANDCGEEEHYETYCERLIIQPVNYENQRRLLTDSIYWKYGEIALVLHAIVREEGEHYVTMLPMQDIREKWNMSDRQIFGNALQNSLRKMPPRLFPIADRGNAPSHTEGVFMQGERGKIVRLHKWSREEGEQGYRLTTSRQEGGAIAIFYPGVKEQLAKLFGGDYYVGFTGIHEAILHPVWCKQLTEMKRTIRHINAVFDEQDMLSNSVYRYCCQRRELLEV